MTQSPSSVATAPAEPAAAASASLTRQGSRFTIIGSAGTGLQLGLYAVLAAVIGAQIASAVSWLLSTLVTNRFHRALTFQVHEHEHSGSDQTVAFMTSLAGLGLTSIVLADLADASGLAGLIAILAVNIAVGAGRFFGLRWWLGGSGRHIAGAVALTAPTSGSTSRRAASRSTTDGPAPDRERLEHDRFRTRKLLTSPEQRTVLIPHNGFPPTDASGNAAGQTAPGTHSEPKARTPLRRESCGAHSAGQARPLRK